jgi:hypothetical protein
VLVTLRAIPYIYIVFAGYCLVYWLIWFLPFTNFIIGSDGSWYFGIGIISLWFLPLLMIGWMFKNVRREVVSKFGKITAHSSFVLITIFFLLGASLWLSLYIYGV